VPLSPAVGVLAATPLLTTGETFTSSLPVGSRLLASSVSSGSSKEKREQEEKGNREERRRRLAQDEDGGHREDIRCGCGTHPPRELALHLHGGGSLRFGRR